MIALVGKTIYFEYRTLVKELPKGIQISLNINIL